MTEAANLKFWQDRWQTGQTRWDLGGPHKLCAELVSRAKELSALPVLRRVLIPGAGRAHDLQVFVGLGAEVVALDLTAEAISAAQALYGHLPGTSFVVGDALDPKPQDAASYDVIFDRAMLCALEPERRADFVRSMAARLKPRGLFLSLAFLEVSHPRVGQPPFAISPAELLALFGQEFELVTMETRRDGHVDETIKAELFVIFQRKLSV